MGRAAKLPDVGIDLFANMERILIFIASATCLYKPVGQNRATWHMEILTRREAAGGHKLSVRV